MFRYLLVGVLLINCQPESQILTVEAPLLNLEQANRLAALPLKCMQQEYPNKLNQTLPDSTALASPQVLHPAFYGCFDWHSSVHGHWMLVKLLKEFPALEGAQEAREKLAVNMSEENIEAEMQYFNRREEKSFERTYGWAWLLKLAEELITWDDPMGQQLSENLRPLADLIVNRYLEFLPKLRYPIRVGTHSNTAFGLTFAWDYGVTTNNKQLQDMIRARAIEFYGTDEDCPISWEPSGYDFLSPCLEEIDIMRRVMEPMAFKEWLSDFIPELKQRGFQLAPGEVSDRSDGLLVHLDGVNFSRAWCLYGLAREFPEYHHLTNTAHSHVNYSLPSIVDGGYEGEHWLASFALYALFEARELQDYQKD
jgi:hypothetical protein